MKKICTYILLLLFFIDALSPLGFLNLSRTQAATTSATYVGTAIDLLDGSNAWTTPTNAQGDTTATAAVNSYSGNGKVGNTLSLTNFNLAAAGISAGDTINGITVEVEFDTTTNMVDNTIQLTKDGITGVGNNAATGTNQIAKAFRIYGGATDLWGTTWTAAELLSVNFGVQINYISTGGGSHTANVYRVRVTIDYTSGGPNNPPTDINLSNNTIDENTLAPSVIGTFSTADIDILDIHTYSLVSGSGDTDNGVFSILGNSLSINEVPDYEMQSQYNIRVRTDDGNGGTFEKAFTISVIDLTEVTNTIIDFETAGKYTVSSGTWTRTLTNPQEGLYSIESGNQTNNSESCFDVTNTFSGQGVVDFYYDVSSEAGGDFLRFLIDGLEVQTWSGITGWTNYMKNDVTPGTHTYTWCYTKNKNKAGGNDVAFVDYITFYDYNNNIPTDISLSSNTIDENSASGSTIGTLSTTDADLGDTHSYTLVTGTGDTDNTSFSISGSTLSISEIPDYEMQSQYSIRIQTDDGNGGTYEEIFLIDVIDLTEAVNTIIDFETPGKYTVSSGTWTRTLTNPQEGLYSIESGNQTNNSESCFDVNNTFSGTGTIDFYYDVSSEAGFDFLRFLIDGLEVQTWSGIIPWTNYSKNDVTSGTHLYTWCYTKNNNKAGGNDVAFVDYITFYDTPEDILPPDISGLKYASGSLLPGGNHTLEIYYSDADSGVDIATDTIALYKWNGITWGPDISATGLNLASKTITATGASYPTNSLDFGKYLYAFQIDDNTGNTASTGAVFYIDEPELIVSTGSIDIGNINNLIESFSDTVTITVRTVGAPFAITLDRTTPFTEGIENIPSWDGIEGYGYESEPFVNVISPINTQEIIGSEIQNINTDGLKNTYTYNIKLGALTSEGQVSGDYIGDLEFGIDLTY